MSILEMILVGIIVLLIGYIIYFHSRCACQLMQRDDYWKKIIDKIGDDLCPNCTWWIHIIPPMSKPTVCDCGFDRLEVKRWTYDDVEAYFLPIGRERPFRIYCPDCGTAGQPGRTEMEAIAKWQIVVAYIREQIEKDKKKQSKKEGG